MKKGLAVSIFAFFIYHFAFAQVVQTAQGLATFSTAAPSGGGGGGGSTSYANRGGTGNRQAFITITSSGSAIPNSSRWVDGDVASNGQFFFSGTTLNGTQWLQFDFGSGNAVVIDEWKYYQQNTTAQGTWKIQGSANASTWTDIGTSFALGGVATQTITAPSGNTTSYRYYRMLGLSGSTSSGPWVFEMEFKILGI